jgi:hypothetical protein
VRSLETIAEIDAHEPVRGVERSMPIGADWDVDRVRVVALLQDTASLAILGAAEVPIAAL